MSQYSYKFLTTAQTTGKSLEEIDLIFAKDEIKNNAMADEVHTHHGEDKAETITVEKV